MFWHKKEFIRGRHHIVEPATAPAILDERIDDMSGTQTPIDVLLLAVTLRRWRNQVIV